MGRTNTILYVPQKVTGYESVASPDLPAYFSELYRSLVELHDFKNLNEVTQGI